VVCNRAQITEAEGDGNHTSFMEFVVFVLLMICDVDMREQ